MESRGQEEPHGPDMPEPSPGSIRNREAIELIQGWFATPDDKEEDYWDELESEIARNRLRLRNNRDLDT
ncbi:MAG: hypothetical protein AB1646_10675 [Thermodesulfobacteriota bacterium]